MAKLSPDQIDVYHKNGYLSSLPFLSVNEAQRHRQRLGEAESTFAPLHYVSKPYLIFTSAVEIATHPQLLDYVESIIGSDVLLWDGAYIIKEPNDGGYVSWHQDLTYWGLDGDEVVTAWVALSQASADNGCMRMMPGSHLGGMKAHKDTFDKHNILHRGQTIEVDHSQEAIAVPLLPGEVSLHHGWVMHESGPNQTSQRRIGLALNYIAPNIRQIHTDLESATLLRGQDRFGYYPHEPLCTEDFAPEAVKLQEKMQDLKHRVYDTNGRQ